MKTWLAIFCCSLFFGTALAGEPARPIYEVTITTSEGAGSPTFKALVLAGTPASMYLNSADGKNGRRISFAVEPNPHPTSNGRVAISAQTFQKTAAGWLLTGEPSLIAELGQQAALAVAGADGAGDFIAFSIAAVSREEMPARCAAISGNPVSSQTSAALHAKLANPTSMAVARCCKANCDNQSGTYLRCCNVICCSENSSCGASCCTE